MRATLAFIALLAVPEIASAHLVSTRFGELYSGLIHPLTALQHLVPWLGLGLLGGLLGRETSRWVLLAFPGSVAGGVLLAGWLPPTAIVDAANILSFIVLGLLIALAARLGPRVFITLTVIVGLSHGYANGTAELSGGPLLLYAAGVTIAAYVLISIVTALTDLIAHRLPWGTIAVRAAGSWIVAVGLVFSGYSLVAAG